MALKKSPPIKPDKSRERRYQLYLLALLGYITRQTKELGASDPDTSASELLRIFDTIQKDHDLRIKKAPHVLESVFTEAADAALSRTARAVSVATRKAVLKEVVGKAPEMGFVETAPASLDATYAVNDALNIAVSENVSLVRGLSQTYLDKVKTAVLNFHQTGQGNLREELQKINGISKNRAKLIARDQMNKLHGDLVMIKAKAFGSIGYQWHNMQDERVRGNPQGKYPRVPKEKDHWIFEGKYFLWEPMKNPPNAPDGKPFNQPPEDLRPGHAINCRCVSAPVFNFS